MNYFITAIGTDSGKTLAAAILANALSADYWKPIQAGNPTDSDEIRRLTSGIVYKEAYLLKTPASPHAAAQIEGINISLNGIKKPSTTRDLVIEGAGGILVPLNNNDYVIDLASKFDAEIILVSNLYLGSINHTLLSIEALEKRGLKLKAIIFNGKSNPSSEEIILNKAKAPLLLHIEEEALITKDIVKKCSVKLKKRWHELGFTR